MNQTYISMFSDIYSVRSVPTSPTRVHFRQPSFPFEVDSPSEHSRIRSPRHYQNWRTSIHPEIDDKYKLIVNGQPLSWNSNNNQKQNLQMRNADKVDYQTASRSMTPQKRSQQRPSKDVEQKIKGLEQQNDSLREELYYLRQALLINFQSKQQEKQKKR